MSPYREAEPSVRCFAEQPATVEPEWALGLACYAAKLCRAEAVRREAVGESIASIDLMPFADAALARLGPPPTSQASVVERIVAELRERADREAATLLNASQGKWSPRASRVLREEADRIEQKHGGRS